LFQLLVWIRTIITSDKQSRAYSILQSRPEPNHRMLEP